MNPFDQCLAFGPVAVYLVLLGIINLVRRPFLVGGARDAAALALALSGLVIVGPMTLVFPDITAARMGPHGQTYVWLLFLALYALGLVLVVLMLRPRLIIYNITIDQFRPILAELVERLDEEARWAGDCLALPTLGVQLHLDTTGWMRNVSLVSAGPKQDHAGWGRLEKELAAALAKVEVPRNPRGMTLFTTGIFLAGMLAWAVASDPQSVARTLFELIESVARTLFQSIEQR